MTARTKITMVIISTITAITAVNMLYAYSLTKGFSISRSLGLTALLGENQFAQFQRDIFINAVILLVLSIIIAILLSGKLTKLFAKIEEQNANLAELNETAKNASEAKSRFLANMSHEMRTPLNAIIGLSELMLGENELESEVEENLEKIHNAGMTLLGLVNDILDLSKVESGKFELISVIYDVPTLINDTVTINIMRIVDKPIEFNLRIDKNIPSKLYGDELRIRQIINNLLSNAFKYTREGNVDLFVNCEIEDDSAWLNIKVKDDGIGIREEDMKKLFSEYNQVDTKSNRKIEGTGLGLSIAKKIVEMMDGTISVESEYGRGSTFTVRVRQGVVTEDIIGENMAENLKSFHYFNDKRGKNAKLVRIPMPYAKVLVVDDVQNNLDVAKGMLKPYGMQIDCVTSGQQAIDRIRTAEVIYNAIFMDHMMPELDGIETVRIIRNDIGTAYAQNIPIIALTANAIIGSDKMFLNNGFQAFLSKPIDIVQLDAVARQFLRDKKQEDCGIESRVQTIAGRDVQEEKFTSIGIGWKSCLERFGGDAEMLLDVLKSYATNTPSLIKRLSAVTAETLPDYAITVHGIKGSSRGICAETIGAIAEKLEHAAKASDFDFVQANNDSFIKNAEEFINELTKILNSIEAEKPKPKIVAPDPDLLERLVENCDNYNMDGIDSIIAELSAFDYETDADLIPWLKERVDRMEFSEIQTKLLNATRTAANA
jgi:signal transduction histidine kinase/FixJ family two-component response regulator